MYTLDVSREGIVYTLAELNFAGFDMPFFFDTKQEALCYAKAFLELYPDHEEASVVRLTDMKKVAVLKSEVSVKV